MQISNLRKRQEDSTSKINFYLREINEIKAKDTHLLTELVIWIAKELSNCMIERNPEAESIFLELKLEQFYARLPSFDRVVSEVSELSIKSNFKLDLEIIYVYYQKYIWLNLINSITDSWNIDHLNTDKLARSLSKFQKSYRSLKEDIFVSSVRYKKFAHILSQGHSEISDLLNKYETPIDTLKASTKELKQAINYPEIAIYRALYLHLKKINQLDTSNKAEFQRTFFDILKVIVRASYSESYLHWAGKEDEQLKLIEKTYQINRFKLRKMRDFTQDR